jgi:hypothetical protein
VETGQAVDRLEEGLIDGIRMLADGALSPAGVYTSPLGDEDAFAPKSGQ